MLRGWQARSLLNLSDSKCEFLVVKMEMQVNPDLLKSMMRARLGWFTLRQWYCSSGVGTKIRNWPSRLPVVRKLTKLERPNFPMLNQTDATSSRSSDAHPSLYVWECTRVVVVKRTIAHAFAHVFCEGRGNHQWWGQPNALDQEGV